MAKPTLVLVHGSWHSPEHFELLQPILSKHGYRSISVSLPSTQSQNDTPKDLNDDTAAIHVVVVAHSYGGCPADNALHGLDKKSRASDGNHSSVLAIVFLAAVPLTAESTFLGALGVKPHPIHDLNEAQTFADVGSSGAGHYFYNDLAPDQVDKYSSLLKSQAWGAYLQETTYAAFVDFPTWYLYCSKDQALLPQIQEIIVGAVEGAGAVVKTKTLESSHSPFLSMPAETAQFIIEAALEAAA